MKKIYQTVLSLSFFLITMNVFSQEEKDFKVFNALLFKNTPDLSEFGFSKINLIYEDGVISTNYRRQKGDVNWRFIDLKKILSESNKSKRNSDVPTCLDVEYWGARLYNPNTIKAAEDIFVELINLYRSNDTNSLVSVFHYGTISEKIYNASNIVYPCFYTHSADKQEWLNMVRYWMNIIKKRDRKMPVYVFIWPQYNPVPSRHNLGYTFVDKDFWRLQLETLYPICDGVVIWSHHRDNDGKEVYFDENMPWFQETLKFMAKYKIK